MHAAGIDALLGGLKRNGFSFTPVHHALRIFQSARKAVDVHQVALAWKRALPVALKLREVEKAGRVIISRRFAIWMLISCITKIVIKRKKLMLVYAKR